MEEEEASSSGERKTSSAPLSLSPPLTVTTFLFNLHICPHSQESQTEFHSWRRRELAWSSCWLAVSAPGEKRSLFGPLPPLGTWKGKGGMVLLLSAAGEEGGKEDLLGGFVLSFVR